MRYRFVLLFGLLFLGGCGYKPTVVYTKEIFGARIYVDVQTDLREPENSVLIKDALREAVIERFKARLVRDPKRADSTITMRLNKVRFLPIQYDKNGYVVAYKTYVELKSLYRDKGGRVHTVTTTGDYDFSIESNSVISDTRRFEAIKFASAKAIEQFISKVSIEGLL